MHHPESRPEAPAQTPSHNLAYDPDQNLQEKREIRRGYRSLIDETNEQQADLKNVKVSQIESNLERGNVLFGKVKDTSEATLDSRYLILASDMGAAKARAMKSDAGGFDVDDFVSKLVTYMGGRKGRMNKNDDDSDSNAQEDESEDDDDGDSPLDWEKVGRLALAKSHRVPVMDLMLGPLSVEQKQRKKVNRQKFEKNKEEERAPQELTEEDIQRAENETTKNVAMITKLLEKRGLVNIFRFVVNPTDFGQTVENLFYLSFLIRDGICALELDEHTGEPNIFSCQAPKEQDYSEGLQKQQIVMELDMDTWKHAIDIFDITEPIIPTRPPHKMRLGNQWYG